MTDFNKEFEKYLNLYLDGEMDPEETREFEKFLQSNPDRQAEFDQYRLLDRAARDEEIPDLPSGYFEGLNARINARIERESEPEAGRSFWGFLGSWVQSINRGFGIAAGILTIAAVVLISRHFMGDTEITKMVPEERILPPAMERSVPPEDVHDKMIPEDYVLRTHGAEPDADTPSDGQIRDDIDVADRYLLPETAKDTGVVENEEEQAEPEAEKQPDQEDKAISKGKLLPESLSEQVEADVPAPVRDTVANEKIMPQAEMIEPGKLRMQTDVEPPDSVAVEITDEIQICSEEYGMDRITEREALPGEDEMDTSLYFSDDLSIKSAAELEPSQFPDLSWLIADYEDALEGRGLAANEKKSDVASLRSDLDEMAGAYGRSTDSGRKVELIKQMLDTSVELARISETVNDRNNAIKLARTAAGMKIISFQRYDSIVDSLLKTKKSPK